MLFPLSMDRSVYMTDFTPMMKLQYMTKMKKFCRYNLRSVDFESVKREIIWDGPD